MRRATLFCVLTALLLGSGLTVLQALLAISYKPQNSAHPSSDELIIWDSVWYQDIAAHGYHSSVPPVPTYTTGNVAFFPGYPLAARVVSDIAHISIPDALVVVSIAATCGFWTLFVFSLLQTIKNPIITATAVSAVVSYPSAFFLVMPYSEGLFLFLLFSYLTVVRLPRSIIAASAALASGFLMSATRLIGAPLVLAAALVPADEHRETAWRLTVAIVSMLGAASFFLFCYQSFGAWDLYFQSQRIGWGLFVIPRALYSYETWIPSGMLEGMTSGIIDANQFSAWLTPWYSLTLVAVLLLDLVTTHVSAAFRTQRLAFYWCSFALHFVAVVGLASLHYQSMSRYTLPSYACLSICFASLLNEWCLRRCRFTFIIGMTLWWVVIALSASLQLPLLASFLRGEWVA